MVIRVPIPVRRSRARAAAGYRRLLVPLAPDAGPAVAMACLLAAEGHATVWAPVVLEVPRALPLDAHLHAEEAGASALGARARAVGARYGVHVEPSVVRARAVGPAIVAAARETEAEIVVVTVGRSRRLAADYVLQHAHCRVAVVTAP